MVRFWIFHSPLHKVLFNETGYNSDTEVNYPSVTDMEKAVTTIARTVLFCLVEWLDDTNRDAFWVDDIIPSVNRLVVDS